MVDYSRTMRLSSRCDMFLERHREMVGLAKALIVPECSI